MREAVLQFVKNELRHITPVDVIDGTVRVVVRILQLAGVLAAVGGAPNRIQPVRARAGQRTFLPFPAPPFSSQFFLSRKVV
jgi:hypothetical protein